MKNSAKKEEPQKRRTFIEKPPTVISFERGTLWRLSGVRVALESLSSPREALVRNLVNGSIERVAVEDLSPDDSQELSDRQPETRHLNELSEEVWQQALEQEKELRTLIDKARLSRSDLEEAAGRLGVSARTLRRKLDSYTQQRSLSALLPKRPGPSKGESRLEPELEVLLFQEIKDYLRTSPDGSVDDLMPVITMACRAMQFAVPSRATVARRLTRVRANADNLAGAIRTELKYKRKPVLGRHESEGPLSIVEMDHTVADVHIIEPTSKRPIGRPVISMTICRHTRVVLGMSLSLEAPSGLSVGLCLHHSVMSKTPWLHGLGLDNACWPGFGLMRQLYTDNAQEFRSMSLRRSCELYGIDMRFRPPGRPASGGIIERAIGTFMTKVRLLPGASYSKLLGKTPRGVDRRATITLADLTLYLAREVSRYHKSSHSGIGEPPLSAWERAWSINGVHRQPRLPGSDTEFLKCFLPGKWRSVTREGVEIFLLYYQCSDLWPLVNSGRKYLVRYDPRDISKVFVEIDGGYIVAPLAKHGSLAFSLWEWREVRAQQIERGRPRDIEQINREVMANRELIKSNAHGGKAKDVRRLARQVEWALPAAPAPKLPEPMPFSLECKVEGEDE